MTTYYLGSKGQGRLAVGYKHWMGTTSHGQPMYYGCRTASLWLSEDEPGDPFFWPVYDNDLRVAEWSPVMGGGGYTALLPWEGRVPTKAQLAPYKPPRRRR